MSITAAELKNNLGKYLMLSAIEDIFITKTRNIKDYKRGTVQTMLPADFISLVEEQ